MFSNGEKKNTVFFFGQGWFSISSFGGISMFSDYQHPTRDFWTPKQKKYSQGNRGQILTIDEVKWPKFLEKKTIVRFSFGSQNNIFCSFYIFHDHKGSRLQFHSGINLTAPEGNLTPWGEPLRSASLMEQNLLKWANLNAAKVEKCYTFEIERKRYVLGLTWIL